MLFNTTDEFLLSGRPVVCCAVVCRESMRHRRQHLRAETRSLHEEAVVASASEVVHDFAEHHGLRLLEP
jgi:hypothetical protein